MVKFILSVLLILGATGCLSQPGIHLSKGAAQRGAERQRELLHGKWLGESPVREGGSKRWLVERGIDGTFVITFLTVSGGGAIEIAQEYGDWGISGDVYFTMTRGWIEEGKKLPIPFLDSYFDDAYLVKELTAAEFIYESVSSGDVFVVKKVSPDFTLP